MSNDPRLGSNILIFIVLFSFTFRCSRLRHNIWKFFFFFFTTFRYFLTSTDQTGLRQNSTSHSRDDWPDGLCLLYSFICFSQVDRPIDPLIEYVQFFFSSFSYLYFFFHYFSATAGRPEGSLIIYCTCFSLVDRADTGDPYFQSLYFLYYSYTSQLSHGK